MTNHPHSQSLLWRALQHEHWFRDREPRWTGAVTSEAACERSRKLINSLRQRGRPAELSLANRLASCAENERCLSGGCPVCMRAFQRWCVESAKAALKRRRSEGFHIASASLVLPSGARKLGKLGSISIENLRRRVVYALSRAEADYALGGVDVSLNVDSNEGSYWIAHVYLFVCTSDGIKLRQRFSAQMRPSQTVSRPVRCRPFELSNYGLSYAWKSAFFRRVTFNRTDGGRYTHPGRALHASELVELTMYLDQCGLEARLLLRGFRIVDTRLGPKIAPLARITPEAIKQV